MTYRYLTDVSIMAQFRYLGTTIANENLIQEGIKRRLNSGNACYRSVQNLSSSRLLYKNIKIRIHLVVDLRPTSVLTDRS
jgi:hypothetical protein